MRSSSDWYDITTMRPSTASASTAAGSARSQGAELVVDLDAQRLERALGRMTAGPLGRCRDGRAHHVHQLGAGA